VSVTPEESPASKVTGSGLPPDEAALVAALKAGEAQAYEQVVRLHAGRLLSVARRVLGHDEDARDALQEALLNAVRSIGAFNGECQLSTWLHRIVVNACLMKLRSRKRRPEQPIDDLLPTFLAEGPFAGAHAAHPPEWRDAESLLARKETRDLVRNCVERLPDSYRVVIVLRDIEELDTAEVGRLLGVTEGAVKVRLHRARQALRTLLDPHLREGSL
jgi:RNA polymerase sigma-70 factor (ECF subfamily)